MSSVLDDQERLICEEEMADAERFWGMEGGAVSTVTDVWAVDVPFGLVAVRVYAVVLVGETIREPVRELVEKDPGVIDTEEAFETLKERILEEPEAIYEGEEEKEEIWG